MAALSILPNEILSLITGYLEHPRDVLYLSLASRRLSEFAKLDGWKAFLRGRFALSGLESDARNSVHGLTTLYRNWDRKGFVARYLEPSVKTTSLNSWQSKRWKGPQGQTMGYQPSIDSYEEMYGGWGERREVLAWSAGTQIVMRVRETGLNIDKIRQQEEDVDQGPDQTWNYDAFNHLNSWFTYKIPGSFEGRDDITSLKLLRPHQRDMDFEDIVFGTASGQLSLLSVSSERGETLEQQYETGRRAVGSTSISSSSSPMLAVTLGDSSLALYPIDRDSISDQPVDPTTQITPIIPGARSGRLWSCHFLSKDKVAVGLGPSYEPIQIYGLAPGGLLSEPIRTFNLESKFWQGSRVDMSPQRSTSIYPILAIPSTAQGGSDAGNTFLTGGYDGIIRLHDMRSARGFETMFWDPTNDSSIYSLAAQGLERVVAGVSMHSMIKVFDLRFSGSYGYHTASLPPRKPRKKPPGQDFASNAIVNDTKGDASAICGGWNLYLNPRVPPNRNAYRDDYWRGREDSPVYSVSIPSPVSQNLYVGLEGSVQSLTFHGIADPHPDTMLAQSVKHFADSEAVDIRASYNPQGDALNLGMYEQGSEEGLGMQLLVQDGVATGVVKNKERRDAARARGLDERWRDLRDEGDRWARGQTVPQTPRRGRGRGRGGRGRGRGG
ncbi:Nn.00g046240.m01.CDS01 [Neocucurbitaria sp. VM-36]